MKLPLGKIGRDISNRIRSVFDNEEKKASLNWVRSRRLKYIEGNSLHTYDLRGRVVYFFNGIELLHSLREIFVDEIYKMKLTSSAPYLLDCGANIGLSVLYLKEQFPTSTIVAFEPDDANYQLLEKNTAGLTNVMLRKEAVWKEDGFIEFAQEGSLSSRIGSSPASNTIRARSVRLKRLLRERRPDFLKLDIEGAEYEVLMDCAEDIAGIENVFIEYHGNFHNQHELNEIIAMLTRHQFSYYIKEAAVVYPTPFYRTGTSHAYDVQLNIFCFKTVHS